ncbi:MAG TPA: 30S ribosome-binding factor RbfA [Saprospiraceae bacterium]|nr:30S ribosome-binding factor RbfA [Saprospiraceae bacterium]
MDSIRQLKVAELLKRNFSIVLVSEGKYIYGSQVLVTVTQVKISPDMSLAKIYLSIFNTENKQEPILEMEESYQRLKQALHQRIKSQLRVMPELKFFLDDTVDEMYKVDALLKKMHDQGQMGLED